MLWPPAARRKKLLLLRQHPLLWKLPLLHPHLLLKHLLLPPWWTLLPLLALLLAPLLVPLPVLLLMPPQLLHPLLVLLAGATAMQWGVGLSPFALTVMVLTAALPSASNVSLLAERMGADNGRIARIILVSTAASFLSFSAAVMLLT